MAAGTLYVVATPIGNLEDVTRRALRVLAQVDLIAAEDTRRTRKLLSHYRISTPVVSYYDAIERRRAPALVNRLAAGESIALVSEAGTPGISDPGYRLVAAAAQAGIKVVPVPGPSALLALLSCSGIPCERFLFEGFLPARGAQRRRRIEELVEEERAMVFFEPMRRVGAMLGELRAAFGDRRAALGRELTKVNEEIIRGKLSDIARAVVGREPRGEATLVVEGRRKKRPADGAPSPSDADFEAAVCELSAEGLPPAEIARALADRFGLSRREAYRRLIETRQSRTDDF